MAWCICGSVPVLDYITGKFYSFCTHADLINCKFNKFWNFFFEIILSWFIQMQVLTSLQSGIAGTSCHWCWSSTVLMSMNMYPHELLEDLPYWCAERSILPMCLRVFCSVVLKDLPVWGVRKSNPYNVLEDLPFDVHLF